MSHGLRSKLILLQGSLAFRDIEAAGAREDPFVTFLEADAAVAFVDTGEFGELDGEFEGATVAITFVGFKVWSWFGHRVVGVWGTRLCR